MKYTAAMFDLDGTLADSLADIAAAGNHALTSLNRAPRPVQDYRYLAGQGIEYLAKHGLETDDPELIARGVELVRSYYNTHGHKFVAAYQGVPALLDALTQRGVKLAVLTNKPDAPAKVLIETLYKNWTFDYVCGAQEGLPLKPDPAAAHHVMQQLDIPAKQWVYVGDTRVDMLTGKAAGMFTVGVTWGFRDAPELHDSGADAVIDEPMQLMDLM